MSTLNQAAFDKSLNGIRRQQYRRAFDAKLKACSYYVSEGGPTSRQGDRCGVGHLLSDELVRDSQLYGTVMSLFSRASRDENAHLVAKRFVKEVDGIEVMLLVHLQNAHDLMLKVNPEKPNEDLVANYEQRMEDIARMFNLQYTAPETV